MPLRHMLLATTVAAIWGVNFIAIDLSLRAYPPFLLAALLPFLLTLAAGFGWAIGNVSNRQARTTEPFRLMLWMTVIPPVPLMVLSILVEGPTRIGTALATAVTPEGLAPTAGLVFTVVIALLAGSGIWTWLLSRHPAGVVAPFSLLVPVFGMTSAWLVLGQAVLLSELVGAVLIVVGVLAGTAGPGSSRPWPRRLIIGSAPRARRST